MLDERLCQVCPPVSEWEWDMQEMRNYAGVVVAQTRRLNNYPYEFVHATVLEGRGTDTPTLEVSFYLPDEDSAATYGASMEQLTALVERWVEPELARHGQYGRTIRVDFSRERSMRLARFTYNMCVAPNGTYLPQTTFDPEPITKVCPPQPVRTNLTHQPTRKRRGVSLR